MAMGGYYSVGFPVAFRLCSNYIRLSYVYGDPADIYPVYNLLLLTDSSEKVSDDVGKMLLVFWWL